MVQGPTAPGGNLSLQERLAHRLIRVSQELTLEAVEARDESAVLQLVEMSARMVDRMEVFHAIRALFIVRALAGDKWTEDDHLWKKIEEGIRDAMEENRKAHG